MTKPRLHWQFNYYSYWLPKLSPGQQTLLHEVVNIPDPEQPLPPQLGEGFEQVLVLDCRGKIYNLDDFIYDSVEATLKILALLPMHQ